MTALQFLLLFALIAINSTLTQIIIWSACDKIIAAIKEEFKP